MSAPPGPPPLKPGPPPLPGGKAPPPLNVTTSNKVPPPLTPSGPPGPPGPPPLTPSAQSKPPSFGPPSLPPQIAAGRDRGASTAVPPPLPPPSPMATNKPPTFPPPMNNNNSQTVVVKPPGPPIPPAFSGARERAPSATPPPFLSHNLPQVKPPVPTFQQNYGVTVPPQHYPAQPASLPSILPPKPPLNTPIDHHTGSQPFVAPVPSHFSTTPAAAAVVSVVSKEDKYNHPTHTLEYNDTLQHRSGVFKNWDPRYVVIKPNQPLQVYETDQMKKSRLSINLKNIIAVPINRGDGKLVIVLYEYEKVAPTTDSLLSQSTKQHYFEAPGEEQRDRILLILHDNGSIVRKPIWESLCAVNKESKFCAIYENELGLYKKNLDDTADTVIQFNSHTFFQAKASTFPMLYDEKTYGIVQSHTFVIATNCNEDNPLYYITMQNDANWEYCVKRTERAVHANQKKVDKDSLYEGYLYKASSNFLRWARRYCILRSDGLSYYKQVGDDKPQGSAPLPNGFELELHPNVCIHPYSLLVSESGDEGTRQYLICALNDPEYDGWSQALGALQQQKSIKKDAVSLKEGYEYVCEQKHKPSRKYIVITKKTLLVYHSRKDLQPYRTIELTGGASCAEASLPDDDTLNNQKLSILSVINNQSKDTEFYLGSVSTQGREEWMTVIKNITGDTISKTHPDSYREGYMRKSKKKGSLGSTKYCVITPTKVYYSDKKEVDVLSEDKDVMKRIKSFDLAGDAIIEEDNSVPGHKGLQIPASGDDGNSDFIYLYFSDPAECDSTRSALMSAMASVDWRRDKSSVFEGYLWKANTSGKSWAFRYIIVTGTSIVYYKKKFDRDPAQNLQITPGLKAQFISLQDQSIGGPDRVAMDNFANSLKIKASSGQDLFAISLNLPQSDGSTRTFWAGSASKEVVQQWHQVFDDLAAQGHQVHSGSVREGYLCVNGNGMQSRRYVALFPDKIALYPSKREAILQRSIPLTAGFDILYKDNHLYIGNDASDDMSTYNCFTTSPGGDFLPTWLQSFQEVYQTCTPAPANNVQCQSCAYVSYNNGPREFLYVVILVDKILLYKNRTQCYPTKQSVDPLIPAAKKVVPYTAIMLTLEDVDEKKFKVSTSGLDHFTFDFRVESEKASFFEAMTDVKTNPGSVAREKKEASFRPGAFTAPVKPKAIQMEDLPPPPPNEFFEEEEDPPPPPPDDDELLPAPPAPAVFVPTPVPTSTPDWDDDDDIPQFMKDRRKASIHQPPTPTPESSFKVPSFKAPISSGSSFGLDFNMDLPPAPVFDLPPPQEDLPPPSAPMSKVTAPTVIPTTTPANKYVPIDFDSDDDDLPPPAPNK